jgi:hypothetical protein
MFYHAWNIGSSRERINLAIFMLQEPAQGLVEGSGQASFELGIWTQIVCR